MVAGYTKHAVQHIHHPGEREITQIHDMEDALVIPAGKIVHAIKHIHAPSERSVENAHPHAPAPVIPAGGIMHMVKHIHTPAPRTDAGPIALFNVEDSGVTLAKFKVNDTVKQGYFKIAE